MMTALSSPESHVIPKVGDGATYTLYTDRYACTVIAVSKSGKKVTLQRDHATLLNACNSGEPDALEFSPGGFCGHTSGTQRFSYAPNPNGEKFVVSFRGYTDATYNYQPRPIWKLVGHATRSPGCSARFGERAEHYDFNF